jgi:hypothetical protein
LAHHGIYENLHIQVNVLADEVKFILFHVQREVFQTLIPRRYHPGFFGQDFRVHEPCRLPSYSPPIVTKGISGTQTDYFRGCFNATTHQDIELPI